MSNKQEQRNGVQAPEYGGDIHVRIIDADNGFRLVSGVYAVRVKSREYNLLIMEDYLPTMGKIDGDIVILTDTGEVALKGIQGYYKHQHNEFTLLIDRENFKIGEKPTAKPKPGPASQKESEGGEEVE